MSLGSLDAEAREATARIRESHARSFEVCDSVASKLIEEHLAHADLTAPVDLVSAAKPGSQT